MSLKLYNPKTGVFDTASGEAISDAAMALNIIIELRVANLLAWGAQRGVVFDTLDGLRQDVAQEL